MKRVEEVLHQKISEAWNCTHLKGTPQYADKQRLICHWNNGESGRSGNKMVVMGVKKGVSDWQYLCDNGKSKWIELKRPGGMQSPDQIRFEKLCESIGHEYYLCVDYYDFWHICGIDPPMPEHELLTK